MEVFHLLYSDKCLRNALMFDRLLQDLVPGLVIQVHVSLMSLCFLQFLINVRLSKNVFSNDR